MIRRSYEQKKFWIGCGNGPLRIQRGQKYSKGQISGIDYWCKKVVILEECSRTIFLIESKELDFQKLYRTIVEKHIDLFTKIHHPF